MFIKIFEGLTKREMIIVGVAFVLLVALVAVGMYYRSRDERRVPISSEEGALTLPKESVEELAEKTGTIGYEVLTRINPLLPRVIV